MNEAERKAKELELRLRAHARLRTKVREPYTGPIENVKPGDLLTWERMDEYEKFIKTKGIKPKRWGRFEEYKDTGMRPFATSDKSRHDATNSDKSSDLPTNSEVNPFEE